MSHYKNNHFQTEDFSERLGELSKDKLNKLLAKAKDYREECSRTYKGACGHVETLKELLVEKEKC